MDDDWLVTIGWGQLVGGSWLVQLVGDNWLVAIGGARGRKEGRRSGYRAKKKTARQCGDFGLSLSVSHGPIPCYSCVGGKQSSSESSH